MSIYILVIGLLVGHLITPAMSYAGYQLQLMEVINQHTNQYVIKDINNISYKINNTQQAGM